MKGRQRPKRDWAKASTQDQVYSIALPSRVERHALFRDDFDRIILAARSELDEAKRKALYRQAAVLLRDEGGVIVPMFNNYIDATSDKVGDWVDDPNGELMGWPRADQNAG